MTGGPGPEAYVVRPTGAVVVCSELYGVNEHVRGICDRPAEAEQRLLTLRAKGPREQAFTLRETFPAPRAVAAPSSGADRRARYSAGSAISAVPTRRKPIRA